MADESIHDLVAFAIVNLGVQVDLDFYYKLTPSDPLYSALLKAYSDKLDRENRRVAMICAVIANCTQGGQKKYEIDDFMPKNPVDEEMKIKANFKAYAAMHNEASGG